MIIFRDNIISLIKSKREDDYWDFKQCHHINKADLLHDIICMANNRTNHNGYIIFGVEDKTFNIIGVENDENRRNQQQIIDFLKSKNFFMGIRPKIELITLEIYGHDIDVIIVYNTLETPYYLSQDYKDGKRIVKANSIYTRTGDTNTDIDKSADGNHVEFLWKKRFGIHLSPFEKLRLNLKRKKDWINTEEYDYNILNPEYTLVKEYDYDSDIPEFYAYTMMNNSVSYATISAKYFGTTLYKRQLVVLDSGRYITVVPEWGFIYYDKYNQKFESFKYFIENDISYDFYKYLFDEENQEAIYAYKRFANVILFFRTEKEKDEFISYVESNIDLLENIISNSEINYGYLEIECSEKKDVIRKLKVSYALKKIQKEFDIILNKYN